MIEHQPYGNDDPYKSTAIERFPRDPGPAEAVQVGFRTDPGASEAWIELRHVSESGATSQESIRATSLGEGLWSADFGPFEGGRVEYRLVARQADGSLVESDHAFEVGRWVRVTGVAGVAALGNQVAVSLQTTGAPARLLVSFPTPGAARCELQVGEMASTPALPDLPTPTIENGSAHTSISGPDIALYLDRQRLRLSAVSTSGGALAGEQQFSVDLALCWLERPGAFTIPIRLGLHVGAGEHVYGLGERFMDAHREGKAWDVRVYEEFKEQRQRTYIPVPFIVTNRANGLWLEADEPSYFDLRHSDATLSIDRIVDPVSPSGARSLLTFTLFAGERPYDVTAAFTRLTGSIAVPPKWAFGPWMSANTWNSQAISEEVVNRTLSEDVPATVIVLEAWSDESTFYIFNDAKYQAVPGEAVLKLADFEFGGRWPDPKSMIDFWHANGLRVVLWQIPVHKRLGESHAQHDADGRHMVENGYVIRNEDGTPYRNKGWWFGDAMVTDFRNPAAAEWWFSKRRYLIDEFGIDGFKTDGGEHLWGRDLRAADGSRGLELFNTYANRYVEAYNSFVQAATGGDGVTFSRSGYTGAQRFPIHWAGDEDSSWTAYRASIKAGLSAGVSGISMWSYDIAGFSGEIPPPDLYMRSTAMAALCPIMQYHSEYHTVTECRDRTPWNIAERHGDPQVLDTYRRYAKLRMRLLDYLHGEAQALSGEGVPLMRYPALEYPSEHDFLGQDEYAYLLGRDLLVAPVTERGVGTREVLLPSGRWIDAWSGSELTGQRRFHAPAPVDRIPVFVKAESPRLGTLLAAFARWRQDEPEG
ncbi:MAG: hypothetical protein KF813_00975 [Trueperaceae bacterium]|nr:hypothetical protein [Trueperaceae bacterium]